MNYLRNLTLWGLMALFFLLPFWPQAARGEEANLLAAPAGNRAILILMDRLTWQDILNARTPHIQKLARAGAVGLVNPLTAGRTLTENAYLTIGAGKKALTTGGAGLAFSYGEGLMGLQARDIYQGRTGNIPAQGELFHVGVARLAKINRETNYGARVGALGDALKAGGKYSAVIGNADTDDSFGRYGVMVAMDHLGLVTGGNINTQLSITDLDRPFGHRTNYDRVLQETLKELPKTQFLVIETGDTYRVDVYRNQLTPDQLLLERNQAIESLDNFIGRLVEEVDLNSTRLILLAPTPTAALQEGNRLTPVIMAGGGVEAGSLLTSDTTHRPGLLTLIDIAPAILKYFNLAPLPEMNGGRLNWVLAQDNLGEILTMNQQLVSEYKNRLWVLLPLIGLLVGLMILGLLSLLLPRFPVKFSPACYRFILLAVVLTPLSALLIGLINLSSPWLEGGIILGINLLLSSLLTKLVPINYARILWAYLLTAGFIGADVLTGSNLMQNSPLGYDPIIGARYYGIGNEYMGILIGASLLGLVPWRDNPWLHPYSRVLLLANFVLITFLLGSPFLGANIGGTITAVAAFGLAYIKLSGRKISWAQGVFLVLSPLLIIGLFLLIDIMGSYPPSHLAKSIEAIIEGGGGEMGRIITRKLAMNWYLFQRMGGFPVILPVLAILSWGWYKSRGLLVKMVNDYPALGAAIRGILGGSLTALIFNDSGIITAGAMIVYLLPVIIYLNLSDKEVTRWNTAGLEIRG